MSVFFPDQAFAKMFNSTPDDLDMHVIYDVSHNIAKVMGQKISSFIHWDKWALSIAYSE